MMSAKYGYFHPLGNPEKIIPFQKLELRHLPGQPMVCPCWIRWVLSLVARVLPKWISAGLRLWLKSPRFWWIKNPQYKLLKSIAFRDSTGTTWEVLGEDNEVSFVFNGLSVPWVFWPVCPADHPDGLAASCIHDYLCVEKPCSSITAARVFWEAMRANGFYRWGALRNWIAVRYCGPSFKPKEKP